MYIIRATETVTLLSSLDIHAYKNNKVKASLAFAEALDFASWLPFAADRFQISKKASDYILVPVLTIPSDLPNRNGVAFPLSELIAWDIEYGMQAYKTWKGKPVHIEHASEDPETAIGIIVDTAMKPLIGFNRDKTWKLLKLLAIDRDKGGQHAINLQNKTANTFSMGAWVHDYSCGYCGSKIGMCDHISKNRLRDFYTLNGKLVYRRVHGIRGMETSIVATPAYLPAACEKVMTYAK